jgi:hypothetical protein
VIASDVKGSRTNLSGADEGIESRANGLPSMLPVRTSARPTVGQLARAQTFRFLTMLATWALIFVAFVYEPGWIRDSLRFISHSIESLADQVTEPWGARLEIMLRELGGMIWIQIASAIVLLRLIIWVPFHIWRLRRERRLRYRSD